MRALGQHTSGESKVLSPRFSAPAIDWKRVALYATLAIGFFLVGFVPTWFNASRATEQRDAAQRGVRLAQLKNTLATAVIDVQRGQYEPARQLTSDFYADLRRQIEVESASLFTTAERERLRSLLAERDELITLWREAIPQPQIVYSTSTLLTTNSQIMVFSSGIVPDLLIIATGTAVPTVLKSRKAHRPRRVAHQCLDDVLRDALDRPD